MSPLGPVRTRRSQAERTAESDRLMLRAAVTLIATKGPMDFTIADVAALAGYSAGLVSHRFGSKSGLLQTVTERIVELFSARILAPAGGLANRPDGLAHFLLIYCRQIREQSELFVAFYRLMGASTLALPELKPTFAAITLRLREAIEAALRQQQQAGLFRADLNPALEAFALVALLRGLANLYAVNQHDIDLERFAAYHGARLQASWRA